VLICDLRGLLLIAHVTSPKLPAFGSADNALRLAAMLLFLLAFAVAATNKAPDLGVDGDKIVTQVCSVSRCALLHRYTELAGRLRLG
jgi:hypothetical protein